MFQEATNSVAVVELGEDVAYRCVAFACMQCDLRLTDGIDVAMISQHESHSEQVTIEIEILETGEFWVLQPVPPHRC
jgi:hypothetical protein